MAWLRVMTVGWLVSAAWADRLRQTRKAPQAPFPTPNGPPVPHPTARGVGQDGVGSHLRRVPGQGAGVLTRQDQHQHLLRRLGRSDDAVDACKCQGLCGMSDKCSHELGQLGAHAKCMTCRPKD